MDKIQEQLKRIYGQLRDLYLSMTPGNRITATLLLLVLLVSLGFLVVGSVKPADPQSKYVYVFDGHEFDSDGKIAVESALGKAGLKDHEWVGSRLRVPRSATSTYVAQISKEGAIRVNGSTSFTTANGLSVWESKQVKNEKMFQAQAIDVAQQIKELDGIQNASVVPNKRRDWVKDILARKDIISVSVTVEPVGYKPLDAGTIAAIGGIVYAGFGTDPKLVNIVDNKNKRIYNGGGEEIGGATNYSRVQSQEEEKWSNKIHNLLNIQGLQVATSVVLTKKIEKYFEVQHEKPKAIIHEHVRGTDYLNEGAGFYGRPGHEASMNRPLIDPRVGSSGRARIVDKTHEAEKTNALQGRETKGENIPLTPELIFASLRIPVDYVRAIWIAKNKTKEEPNPQPTPEQLEEERELIRTNTKRIVAKQLEPYKDPKKPDALDSVEVEFYETMEPDEEPELTAWQKIEQWLTRNWQTLGLMGLVLGGLCVLWAISRPAKPEPIVIYEAPEIPMDVFEAHANAKAEAEAAAAENEDDDEVSRTLEGFDKSIRSLQEEIAELVEENPDAAAAVLRQWIGTIVPAESK